ncbi:cytochrome P450 [Xylariaceae sp. AK1471]|nr:cytochrome P450 [Xylariaceae sp. AK1471]
MDLCDHPEYVEVLRNEYSSLSDDKGFFPPGGFSRLTKMDSCMKESQRFWPPTILTFERIMNDDRTLTNGLTVPAGHRIAASNYAVNMDPKIYPDPERFDGLRFEKIREKDPSVEKAQFVACNQTSLSFGYGRHACPGRVFFAEEFKAIMVHLLETFNIKFPPGKEGRLPNLEFETHYIANPQSKVMFKWRKPCYA